MRARAFGLICAAFALTAIVFAAPSTAAPKINPIVEKMIAAYGGSAVLNSIKTRVVTVAAAIQGEAATITTTYEWPNEIVQVIQIPALRVTYTTGYDGSVGWARDSYGQIQAQTGDQLTLLKCLADNPIEAVLKSGGGTSDASVESSTTTDGGKKYDVLRVTQPGCPVTTLLLDTTTHLVVRESTDTRKNEFSNYDVDSAGEKYPKTVVTSASGATTVGSVTSVQDNVTLDPSIFAMPAPGSSPAPAPGLATPSPRPSPTTVTPAPTGTQQPLATHAP
jgi:hypothetical protein